MNANELADAMEIRASIRRQATSRKSVQENANDRLADQLDEAATMLRQQQAEIEALKQIIDANNLNQNIGQFVKPTNEPVAWMDDLSFFTEQPDDMDGVTPLYTHPVKELGYNDIMGTWWETMPNAKSCEGVFEFARAILRKAQEK